MDDREAEEHLAGLGRRIMAVVTQEDWDAMACLTPQSLTYTDLIAWSVRLAELPDE